MASLPRLLALPASVLVLLAATAALVSPPAGALPVATITGQAPAAASSPGTVSFTYTITLPAAVDSAVFSTGQDSLLPASATGVTLDGTPVPAGQVSTSAPNISVQAGPLPTDGLAAGTHTVQFSAAGTTATTASTSSTATLSYSVSGTPGTLTSTAVTVGLNQPDLAVALTPDSGEDQIGLLGTGRDIDMLVDVHNAGRNAASGSLLINLPVGLQLGLNGVSRDSDGSSVHCAPVAGNAQQQRCGLGAIQPGNAADPTLDIDLTATPAAPIGQVVAIGVSVSPDAGQGTDTQPANDAVSARLQFTGSARLSYSITPAKTRVPLGGKTTVKLTIHNAGPQPAPQTIAFTILVGGNFTIVGFTGSTAPPAGMTGAAAPMPAALNGQGGAELLWFAGDIPAGQSVTATLTVQARVLGTGKVGLAAFSGASDPNCPDFNCEPSSVSLQAVAVPVVATSTPAPAAIAGPELPRTGQDWSPALQLSGLLLLAGCALLLAGRRRLPSYAGRRRAY